MILYKVVPPRRNEASAQFKDTLRPRAANDFGKYCVFDTAAQDPATHQPAVDFPDAVLRPADDDADHAVVAEPVPQPNLRGEDRRIGFHAATSLCV